MHGIHTQDHEKHGGLQHLVAPLPLAFPGASQKPRGSLLALSATPLFHAGGPGGLPSLVQGPHELGW